MRALLMAAAGVMMFAAPVATQSIDTTTACGIELRPADFTGAAADIARALDLLAPASTKSFFLRRSSDRVNVNACAAPHAMQRLTRAFAIDSLADRSATVLPVFARMNYNSRYPRDWNDGELRSGAGVSVSITPGVELRWGALEAAFAPVVALERNERYTTSLNVAPGYSPFIHRWHGRFIDLPQRFGTSPHTRVAMGQSYIRAHSHGLRGGLSTENIAWGPARRNALLLSGTAAGFPHLFVESARAHDLGIATAEFQVLWGRLSESEFFDFDPDNDHRMLTGAFAALRPKGLEGLYVGAGHLHSQTWGPNASATDLLWGAYSGIGPDSSGLPRDLRLVALYMRWANAPGGLEIYGEWARQDTGEQWLRLLNPVDAAQAYSLGVQRVVRRGDVAVRLSAEFSHLSDAVAHRDVGRGIHTYYVSPHLPQGHTHQGQLLGAPIGPGSEAQFIGADVFWEHGRSSFSIERARYDDDAYYSVWAWIHGPHGHDTEISVRAGHVYAGADFSVEAELGYSFRYSRALLGLHHGNHPGFPYREDQNLGLRLSGRWLPPDWSLSW